MKSSPRNSRPNWIVSVDGDVLGSVRLSLAAARDAGIPFHEAWEPAREAALAGASDRGAWSAALTDTRTGWRSAYYRLGPPLKLDMDLVERDSDQRRPDESLPVRANAALGSTVVPGGWKSR